MFILTIYWLVSPILWIFLPIFAIFYPKIRHHWQYGKTSIKSAKKKIDHDRGSRKVAHFHAASAGEFEQLHPVLKQIDRSRYFILLSFFSPTIFIPEKDTDLADAVCYHPFDFIWSAWLFFKKLKIQYYIITRNDIWPTHLFIANHIGIHTVLINANFYREKYYRFFLYRSFLQKVLDNFNLILTSSDRLKVNLLNLVSHDTIKITGDSRMDRVLERQKKNTLPLLPNSFKESHSLILGSLIPSDYPYIFGGLEQYYPNGQQSLIDRDHRIIIVPHEICKTSLKNIERKLYQLKFEYTYYSQTNKLQNSRVIIVNKIGLLADLYAYSEIAYVGAGFGAGVHSVFEPAVYQNALSFGPNFHIVDLAVSLVNNNLASVIKTEYDFAQFCTLQEDKETLKRIKTDIKEYLLNQPVAAKQITKAIFYHD